MKAFASPRKVLLIILGVILLMAVILIAIVMVDKIRVENNHRPIFAKQVAVYDDGGTTEYNGLYYQIIRWKRISQNTDGQIGYEIGTECHSCFTMIDVSDGPTISLEFIIATDMSSDMIQSDLSSVCSTIEQDESNGQGVEYTASVRYTAIESEDFIGENEIDIKVKHCLQQIIPFEKYTLIEKQEYPERQQYQYTYTRRISGYDTSDYAYVLIDFNGEIAGYGAPNIGIFETKKVPKIVEDQIYRKLDQMVKDELGDIQYEIRRQILCVDGDEFFLQISIQPLSVGAEGQLFYVPV